MRILSAMPFFLSITLCMGCASTIKERAITIIDPSISPYAVLEGDVQGDAMLHIAMAIEEACCVEVRLYGGELKEPMITKPDYSGHFVLANVPSGGNYILKISYPGYLRAIKRNVVFSPGEHKKVTCQLSSTDKRPEIRM